MELFFHWCLGLEKIFWCFKSYLPNWLVVLHLLTFVLNLILCQTLALNILAILLLMSSFAIVVKFLEDFSTDSISRYRPSTSVNYLSPHSGHTYYSRKVSVQDINSAQLERLLCSKLFRKVSFFNSYYLYLYYIFIHLFITGPVISYFCYIVISAK